MIVVDYWPITVSIDATEIRSANIPNIISKNTLREQNHFEIISTQKFPI